jgi:hypothetical protein
VKMKLDSGNLTSEQRSEAAQHLTPIQCSISTLTQ